MKRFVVDTNVAVVANGRGDPADGRPPSRQCRQSAIEFLMRVIRSGKVLIDLAGEIQNEYHRYLNPNGQPGVGDRFYLQVLNSAPRWIERVELPFGSDGEYIDLPPTLLRANFDRSDRKFAAGIRLKFICGRERSRWFDEAPRGPR